MKKFGKIIICFFITILFGIAPVYAVTDDEITLDDIVEKVKTYELYDYLNLDDGSVTFDIEVVDNKILVEYTSNVEEELNAFSLELVLEDGILTYTYPGPKTSMDEGETIFFDTLVLLDVFNAVAELNGYTREQVEGIPEEMYDSFTIANNGLEITSFTITEESFEDDVHFTGSITGIDTFKIDINNFRVDFTSIESVALPIIEIGDTTHNSVALNISTGYTTDKVCYISRSVDGINYEVIDNINCNTKATYTDTKVEQNKTYYYKVSLDNQNFSNVVYTTTKEFIPVTVENPKTGVSFPILAVGVLIIGCMVLFGSLKNKNLFRKI